MRPLRIYPAGPIQGATLLESLTNLHRGLELEAKLRMTGFAPFPVFSDFQDIMLCEPMPPIDAIYLQSLVWLEVAHAVFMLPGWQHSTGATQERQIAFELDLPIFDQWDDLLKWRKEMDYAEELMHRSDD